MDELVQDPANLRVHPEQNKKVIRGSVRRFGPARSIVIDQGGVIIAGNETANACAAEGLTEVLVVDPKPGQLVAVRRSDWSETEKTGYGIADNQTGSWSFFSDELPDAINSLQIDGFDLDALGFSEDELRGYLEDPAPPPSGEDVPDVEPSDALQEKWGTCRGQLWIAGNHRLACGDSAAPEDLAKAIGSKEVGLVLSDPPYGMNWNPDSRRFSGGHRDNSEKRGQGKAQDPIEGDDRPFDPSPWLKFPAVILWGYNHFASRLPVGTSLVWIKRNDTAFQSFLSDAELGWMKGGYGVYCFRDLSMVAHALDRVHQNQKPLPLIRWCVEMSKSSGVILDPYAGSGTTLVASEQAGRPSVGIEIEPKYCAAILERLSGLGLEPKLAK